LASAVFLPSLVVGRILQLTSISNRAMICPMKVSRRDP
jgi:hypothetical protein